MSIITDICAVPDCGKIRDKRRGSSLCGMHRTRMSRHKSLYLPSENKTQADSDAIYKNIKRQNLAKGKVCSVSNCVTQVYGYGTICSKHRWRIKNLNSFDLPDHTGEPNYIVLPDSLPEGIVHECGKGHGYLNIEEVYGQPQRKNKSGGIQYHCKKCVRDANIKRLYKGMNGIDDYNKMLNFQNGVCAICYLQSNKKSNNSLTIKSLAIDHCHKSNTVRGLLCDHCNQGIGHFRDSIELLHSAISYLKNTHPIKGAIANLTDFFLSFFLFAFAVQSEPTYHQ